MSRYIKTLSGGDVCVVIVREILVAVGEVDRRVLVTDIDAELGLITSVWSRIGQMAQTLPSTAEGHRRSSDSSQWCR